MMTGFDVGNGGNGAPADFIFANLNGFDLRLERLPVAHYKQLH